MEILIRILGILNIVAGITLFALWGLALYGAFARKDLKNSRALWIVLLIFVAPIGTIAYGFSENRKKIGVWGLILVLYLILIMPILFGVSKFILQSNFAR